MRGVFSGVGVAVEGAFAVEFYTVVDSFTASGIRSACWDYHEDVIYVYW